MIAAGVHFGHRPNELCPINSPFIIGERGGSHIIDLSLTHYELRRALVFIHALVKKGGSVCFVATNPDVARLLAGILSEYNLHSVGILTRWFPGLLTNWDTVFEFVNRVKQDPTMICSVK